MGISLLQLILNGNEVTWSSVSSLLAAFPSLAELRVSNNKLGNPDSVIHHLNIQEIFLSLNPISDFSSVVEYIITQCPRFGRSGLFPS